jgi:aquaporin Z
VGCYWGEFLGAFALVLAGCGAIVANEVYGGVVTQVGVALGFGLIVMTMIYAVGDLSGAHLNPVVVDPVDAECADEGVRRSPHL